MQLCHFGLLVKRESFCDTGFKLVHEGVDSSRSGISQILISLVGVSVGLLQLIDLLEALLLNFFQFDVVQGLPQLLLEVVELTVQFFNCLIILIKDLRLGDFVLLTHAPPLPQEVITASSQLSHKLT